MAIELTNITQARNNVPFNAGAEPKYILKPGECILIPDEYLASLDADAQQRFLRVTSGLSPMFTMRKVDDVIEQLQSETEKKLARGRKKKGQVDESDELPSQLP